MKLISNNIIHSRLKIHPKVPKTTEEAQATLYAMEMKTIRNEDFLMFNQKSSVTFSCESNLKYMCKKEIILMDGTFEMCIRDSPYSGYLSKVTLLMLFGTNRYFEDKLY